jgi:hypothetical protein
MIQRQVMTQNVCTAQLCAILLKLLSSYARISSFRREKFICTFPMYPALRTVHSRARVSSAKFHRICFLRHILWGNVSHGSLLKTKAIDTYSLNRFWERQYSSKWAWIVRLAVPCLGALTIRSHVSWTYWLAWMVTEKSSTRTVYVSVWWRPSR